MSDDLGAAGAPAGAATADPPEGRGVMRPSEVMAIVEQAFDDAAAKPEAEDTWMTFGPETFAARAIVADYLRTAIGGLHELVDWLVSHPASATRPESAG